MDASDFEDGCRARLGTSAFELFTLEWLVEQVHRERHIESESVCVGERQRERRRKGERE